MRKRLSAAVGAALVLFGVAGMAQAAMVTVRYTGDINYIHQPLDPFGLPDINGPLAPGVGFAFDVTYDTAIGTLLFDPFNSLLYGPQDNSSIRSWKLTINGVTDAGQVDPGEFYNNQTGRSGGPGGGQLGNSFDGGLFNVDYWGVTINAYSTAANTRIFTDPFVAQNVTGIAGFTHYLQSGGVFSHLYHIGGTVTGVSVLQDLAPGGASPTGAVPEPAAWAMMIMGFGAAGAVMRRRRRLLA